jgi:para-nitrobenzyl esterase
MNKTFTLFIAFAAVFSSSFAQVCADRYLVNSFDSVVVTTVKYGEAPRPNGTNQELFMNIYQPYNDTLEQRPVVIFAFGGSFIGGSKTSAELVYMSTELAKKGYVCASIDYRLANSAFDLIQEEVMVKTVFKAIQDGKAAIRFFRKDANTDNIYKVDSTQIFVGGTSAGGILAINLTYGDEISKLPANWQTWATEIGGLEGSSGNPGYCSHPQGVFAFAGAVGDTLYIGENAVPFYGSHSTGDQTVRYNYGAPLQGLAPVELYGSGLIDVRLNNLGVYSELDTYNNSQHPPLMESQAVLEETNDNLTAFLFNILDCNPDNRLTGNEKRCGDAPTSIRVFQNNLSAEIYPNPAQGYFNFTTSGEKIDEAYIFNSAGVKVKEISASEINAKQVNISDFSKGIYFVHFTGNNVKLTKKLIVQ